MLLINWRKPSFSIEKLTPNTLAGFDHKTGKCIHTQVCSQRDNSTRPYRQGVYMPFCFFVVNESFDQTSFYVCTFVMCEKDKKVLHIHTCMQRITSHFKYVCTWIAFCMYRPQVIRKKCDRRSEVNAIIGDFFLWIKKS